MSFHGDGPMHVSLHVDACLYACLSVGQRVPDCEAKTQGDKEASYKVHGDPTNRGPIIAVIRDQQ